MWLIVGLGNPGSKYLMTRHNLGFMALDYLAKSLDLENAPTKSEFKAFSIDFKWDDSPVKLVKPLTYMNLSGESVGEISRFYKIPIENMIVIFDDVDTPFGQIRLKTDSGDGGHNGIKSLIEHLGTKNFIRIKVGVGRPPHPEMEVADYVLQNFSKQEQEHLSEILNTVCDATEAVIFDGFTKAQNIFNSEKK